MRFEISDETLKRTTKCPWEMRCLSGWQCGDCVIEMTIRGDEAFIRSSKPDGCPYKISYGYGYVCTCPTRSELHEKYGV